MNAFNGFALRWTLDQQRKPAREVNEVRDSSNRSLNGNDGESPSTSTMSVHHGGMLVHGRGDNNHSVRSPPVQGQGQGHQDNSKDKGITEDMRKRLIPAINELHDIFKATGVTTGSGGDGIQLPRIRMGDQRSEENSEVGVGIGNANGLQDLCQLLGHIQDSLPSIQDQIESQTTECLRQYYVIRRKLEELEKARDIVIQLQNLV